MVEFILYLILFITGIFFGSFFTLATYRIPKQENILYKHSYCPNCNHKLGTLELIPLFSYLFLGGKCKHCHQKISIRYFLIELITGITFVLFGFSLHIDVYAIQPIKIVYFILGIFYFSSLFLLSGIDKEQHMLPKSILIYGVAVCIGYMIYAYMLQPENIYAYVIYLIILILLLLFDTVFLKRNLSESYTLHILILMLYMLIFSGIPNMILTLCLTILIMGIQNILYGILNHKKVKKEVKKKTKSVAFYLCISNILVILFTNIMIQYMLF